MKSKNPAQALQLENIGRDALFQILDVFPYPIQIFAPDGMMLFANQAMYEETNLANPKEAVGRYNILRDPVTLDALGLRESVEAIFRGERRTIYDVRIPYEDLSVRYTKKDEQFDKVKFQDITGFQVRDERQGVSYIIMLFVTKQTYRGSSAIIRAQEYIKQNWLEEFDIDRIARTVNLSPRHFQRMFKDNTGVTPGNYYKRIKIEKLKENLRDYNLSIEQAFTVCGVEYHGKYFQYFKDIVGMSPSGYRKEKLSASQRQ